MSRLRAFLAVSFRAKVLVPVIAVMVVLIAVTAWIVNKRITKQFEMEAMRALVGAEEGFRDWQKNRAKNLLLRVADLRNSPRFIAGLQNGDPPTIRAQVDDLLKAADPDVKIIQFTAANDEVIASPRRDLLIPTAQFESNSMAAVKFALEGEEKVDTIQAGDKLYDVVAIPVFKVSGELAGALTFGMEIGNEAAEELSRFTRSQIVMLANDQVVVRRIAVSDASARFASLFKELAAAPARAATSFNVKQQILDGEHYYCAGSRLPSLDRNNSLGYLLLYSYEDSWRALQTTQQILFAVSAAAILIGSIIVCILVGKVTRPLRELRDSAEAVGRGDFSRRVVVRYEDECGELARVFNQMTENLKNSREQLEMTVETLKTTQAQLIQSEKLSGIGEFIAGVAHELNNPLTSVMGFSELLQHNEQTDPKQKRHLEMIYKSALRCQKIVQALLSFARRRAPERKPACVNELIEAAVEILQYQLRTSNVEVSLRLDPNLPQAMVDPHQLQQVFVNIINNARQAIEAHQPKGNIRILTETPGDVIRITIQDNGPGISQENLSKIFDPFFTTKEVGKGTGLGLSLCYGIIKEHGGTISPRSRPGEGATFVIELPIAAEGSERVEETPAETVSLDDGEGRGKKVLVIDDEEPILQMVREALVPHGYEVDIAPDGETALRQLSRKKYDLALCDWKMPGLNGQQVYERVRAVNPALSERFIFVTGDVINEKTRKFLEQQNKICLPKPFTLLEFRAAIKKVLAGS